MNKLIIAGVAGALFAGSTAMAAEPVSLTDGQMDGVTAGWYVAAGGASAGSTFVATSGPSYGGFETSAGGGGLKQKIVSYESGCGSCGSTFTYTRTFAGDGATTTSASYGSLFGGMAYTGRSFAGGFIAGGR
jgi:hypothetical protein